MIDINVLVWIAIIVLMLISKILADMYINMEKLIIPGREEVIFANGRAIVIGMFLTPALENFASFKKNKWIGYYMDKIHTSKDTTLDMINIEAILAGLEVFICD